MAQYLFAKPQHPFPLRSIEFDGRSLRICVGTGTLPETRTDWLGGLYHAILSRLEADRTNLASFLDKSLVLSMGAGLFLSEQERNVPLYPDQWAWMKRAFDEPFETLNAVGNNEPPSPAEINACLDAIVSRRFFGLLTCTIVVEDAAVVAKGEERSEERSGKRTWALVPLILGVCCCFALAIFLCDP